MTAAVPKALFESCTLVGVDVPGLSMFKPKRRRQPPRRRAAGVHKKKRRRRNFFGVYLSSAETQFRHVF